MINYRDKLKLTFVPGNKIRKSKTQTESQAEAASS